MSEQLNVIAETNQIRVEPITGRNMGRITILEALAQETSMVSPDALGRCTMQGNVDFDD